MKRHTFPDCSACYAVPSGVNAHELDHDLRCALPAAQQAHWAAAGRRSADKLQKLLRSSGKGSAAC